MNLKQIRSLLGLPFGGYSHCVFAVTNRCNGHCGFCGMHKQPPKPFLPFEAAARAVSTLYALGIRHIQLTGGEPLLYPDLFRVMRHGAELGTLMTIVTNGSLLNEATVSGLAASGIVGVGISIDHPDEAVFEANRGIPGLAETIRRGLVLLRERHVAAEASTLISTLLSIEKGDYLRLLEKNQSWGMHGTYFCYPLSRMGSHYTLGGELAEVSRAELLRVINHLRDLKQRGYAVANPDAMLDIALEVLDSRPARYPCVAGYKVFYLDWELNLHDCMTLGRGLGNLARAQPGDFHFTRRECDRCYLTCAREPSLYYHGWRSAGPLIGFVRDAGIRDLIGIL